LGLGKTNIRVHYFVEIGESYLSTSYPKRRLLLTHF